jgi:hypothetical protein
VTGPEDTLSNYLMCRFMRYGCAWHAKWLPGGEFRAQSARIEHERTCVYRFHQTRP